MRKNRQLITSNIMCSSMSAEVNKLGGVYVFAIGWRRSYEDQLEELLERSRKAVEEVVV